MDSSGSRASRGSTEGFSSEEDGDCDVFLSDSDSDKHVRENGPCLDSPTGLPVRDGSTFIASEGALTRPQAFIPHPMSATHLKKPLENIYFASASAGQRDPLPAGADLGRDWDLPLGGRLAAQRSKRLVSRGLKRRWEEPRQHGTALGERTAHAKTRGDLLFAQKCKELQVFIRPLTVLLNGLKTGRYNKGLSSFQQSVAMDRFQRIVGVLQKPAMGERYLGTLLQVEMMLKVWFPHVTVATPSSEGSGPAGTECSARKLVRTGSSGTSSSRGSESPPSSRRHSCGGDGGAGETPAAAAGRSRAEGLESRGGAAEEGPPGSGLAWLRGQEDGASAARCLALVMQDSSVSSSTHPRFDGMPPQPWMASVGPGAGRRRPERSLSAPPLPAAVRGDWPLAGEGRGLPARWPHFPAWDSFALLDLREREESERPSK